MGWGDLFFGTDPSAESPVGLRIDRVRRISRSKAS
jgi:hypothetical protein